MQRLVPRVAALLSVLLVVAAHASTLDAALRERIDGFVASEVDASGLPGVAIAVLSNGQPTHVRGFGHDGRGNAITGDTPFPIGSLTKSFTALLVRQAIETGQIDIDAPVQRYLPWFRVADQRASQRITIKHLLNQTSGFSRTDGIAPLLAGNRASVDELVRGLASVSPNRPIGERFEYSNLNYVLLGAVLQAVSGKPWEVLLRERVLQPLSMTHSHTDHAIARGDGMTATHQIVFGVPMAREIDLMPAFAPAGGLIASANDMARYLQMLLAGGAAPSGRMLSLQGVAQLLAPASSAARTSLLSADFAFRYGEGWFVGPFGAAADARWHLGSLTSFAAWMVLLPETKQAVVVLINANTELPMGEVNAVMSRLPVGVVNLLRGQAPPSGPNLRAAYARLAVISVFILGTIAALGWWAVRARRGWASASMALLAIVVAVALPLADLGPSLLWVFAPELAIVFATLVALLALPIALRALRRFGTRAA